MQTKQYPFNGTLCSRYGIFPEKRQQGGLGLGGGLEPGCWGLMPTLSLTCCLTVFSLFHIFP